MLKLKGIEKMSTEELIVQFARNTVISVHDINSKGAMVKSTIENERKIVDELSQRLNLNREFIYEELNK